ncbi:MAG: hypothetical protein ACREU1_11770 [Burkholderiales bacterium]
MSGSRWYRDGEARSLILVGYLPWLAGLNLAWETAHLPLYTLWGEASAGYIAFSVAHCTLGDLAIGLSALVFALVLTRSQALASWRWRRIAVLTTMIGIAYTAFSEWMNIVALQSWKYSDLMPVLGALGVEVGLSPLAQWLLIPALALLLARRRHVNISGPSWPPA